jgi:hypothetical protein
MKNFLLKIFLFCLLPVPLLVFLDHAVEKGLHSSRYLYLSDWNDLFGGKINADIIVLGTSRAYVHVSPAILDSALHLNSYNLGMDGASFDIQNDILKLYLRHNKKPLYILQEVGYPTFEPSEPIQYFREFAPYSNDTAVWNIIKQHYSSAGWPEHYFPLFKYNGHLLLIKEGLMNYIGHGEKDVKYKGYEARDYAWDSTFYEFKKSNPNGKAIPIDSSLVALFGKYLDRCKAAGIKVIMFYPPTYYISRPYLLNFERLHTFLVNCAAEHGVPFLDHTNDPMNYEKSYFYNTQHLNKKGSEVFSRELAAEIKKVLETAQ